MMETFDIGDMDSRSAAKKLGITTDQLDECKRFYLSEFKRLMREGNESPFAWLMANTNATKRLNLYRGIYRGD